MEPAGLATGYVANDERAAAALGGRLFSDPRLSEDGQRSCETCHQPAQAFAEHRARAVPRQPWRGAAQHTHAAQCRTATGVVHGRAGRDTRGSGVGGSHEPDGDGIVIGRIVRRLGRDPVMRHDFGAAFAVPADSAVTAGAVRLALGAYLRSLVSLDSPVDRALRGDIGALTADARAGFTVFMGKGRCGTCHFAPLFNGTVPPLFREVEVEVIGVPASQAGSGAHQLSGDPGRAGVDELPAHRGAFRTPGVRFVAETAPYFHHGAFTTLDAVIAFYNGGGGAGAGINIRHQTLPRDSLRLTADDSRALVAFLRSLSGSADQIR